ncbi:hypothetical protein [Stappia sp. WLB 29]|uniref:hypothetical protein n=1 Tax=Stappia sp. WLB 29 TaxID=2925220 RepID=UPI0020BED87E|nr:hypothetical protein [Stappia sp. WLB 29]
MRQTTLCLGFGLLAGLGPAAALADYVVIAASGASGGYSAGTEIADDQQIDLPQGARLTLIERSGRMVTLEGLFSGTVPAPGETGESETPSTGWDALKRLVGSAEASSTVLGAARAGAGDIPPPPGVWDLSTDSSGPRCVRKGQLTLWRKQANESEKVSARSAAGRHDGIVWKEGEHRLALPEGMAMEDGRIVVSVAGELRDFELSVMPETLAGAPGGQLLGWLAEHNCRRQALALIARLHAGETAD